MHQVGFIEEVPVELARLGILHQDLRRLRQAGEQLVRRVRGEDQAVLGARPVAPQRWKTRSRLYKAAIWVAYGIVRLAMGFLAPLVIMLTLTQLSVVQTFPSSQISPFRITVAVVCFQALHCTGELVLTSLHLGLDGGDLEIAGVGLKGVAIVFTDAHSFKQLKLDQKPALLLGMNAMRAFKKVSIDFATRKLRVVVPEESALDLRLATSRLR